MHGVTIKITPLDVHLQQQTCKKHGQQENNMHGVLVTLGVVFVKSKKNRETGVSDG
jgi:hypothetical protein